MSDGSEFQVCGAATENAGRANSVRVLAADSIGASEDRTAFSFFPELLMLLHCGHHIIEIIGVNFYRLDTFLVAQP